MKQVAAIAIINDHHILMGKRRDNQKFTNPGGHLNEGEDPVSGAVREVKEETGLDLNPHLFKHLETRTVTKRDGKKIKVHGYRVDLRNKPTTSMKQDPDAEVHRWHWIKLDTELDHIKDNLHVPVGDNVLLDNIFKEKSVRRHIKRFWDGAKKIGVDDIKDKALKELPQQYFQRKDDQKKTASVDLLPGGKGDNRPDSAFPLDQLRKGERVESEHTKNLQIRKEIAKDHLTENAHYYDRLEKMEKQMDKKAFWNGFEKRAMNFNFNHSVKIPKETEEALFRVAKGGADELKELLKQVREAGKFKPKDVIVPLIVGGLSVGSSLYLGKSLGKRIAGSAPGVFSEEADKNKRSM